MKRFLSLVLTLVMVMSLVTVSAGAKEFTDGDTITYQEAVDVISTIGVVDGDVDGSFRPTDVLTRQAAAKIICNLILGPTTAAELHADTAPYRDVPTTSPFSGYIAYCAKEGIISGYGNGTFRPTAPLTGYAFMKMLLGALGYDANYEQYVGNNWSINVAKQAIGIGLNNSLVDEFNGLKSVTREEACLYAFNTLMATTVGYDQKITTTVNGVDVTISNGAAKVVSWTEGTTRNDHIKNDGLVQFAEEYFGKLYLTKDVTVFGQPDREWEFEGKEIGTYINTDLLDQEYTKKVTGKDLYDQLGKNVIDDYALLVTIDGQDDVKQNGNIFTAADLYRANTDKIGATGKGVLTQVFVNPDKDEYGGKTVFVAIINTYLAKANEDYNEKDEDIDLKVYKIDNKNTQRQPDYQKTKDETEIINVDGEDFDIKDITKDELFLVTVADGEIQSIVEPEILSESSITSFKKTDWVKSEGTQYDYADTAMYDEEVLDEYDQTNMKDVSYNIILDEYGYLIGLELNEDPDQYVFLTGIDANTSNLSVKTADANIIHLDGTMETVTVDMQKSKDGNGADLWDTLRSAGFGRNLSQVNTWCKYSVASNGNYTLKQVKVANDTTPFSDGDKNKVAQYAQDVGTSPYVGNDGLSGGNQTTMEKTISEKRVSLLSWYDSTNAYAGSRGYVYGNDSTIYINVELKNVPVTDTNHGGRYRQIIDDVESVTTGVKNVELVMKNLGAATTADGTVYLAPIPEIYTLYKKDGNVIAAVTIGENQGSASKFAYIISDDVSQEDLGDTTGETKATGDGSEWTWHREAVVDGKITMLTEVNDTIEHIGASQMKAGRWYEIRYDSKGNVRKGEDLTEKLLGVDKTDKYVNDALDVEQALVDNNTVLLWDTVTVGTANQGLKFVDNDGTLWLDEAQHKGISVSPDVQVVLCLADEKGGDKGQFDDNEDKYTGYSGLAQAITDMNAFHTTYEVKSTDVHVSAIMSPSATVIVINDRTPSMKKNPNAGDGSVTLGGTTVDFDLRTVTTKVMKGSSADAQAQTNFRNALSNTEGGMLWATSTGSSPRKTWNIVTREFGSFYGTSIENYGVYVNGSLRAYVEATGAKTLGENISIPRSNGTGFILGSKANYEDDFDNFVYYDYAANSGLLGKSLVVDNHLSVISGYVKVDDPTADVRDFYSSYVTFTDFAYTGDADDGYARYGSNINVEIDGITNSATSVIDGRAVPVTLKMEALVGNTWVDGGTVTVAAGETSGKAAFTLRNVTGDVTATRLTVVKEAESFTVANLAVDGIDITVDSSEYYDYNGALIKVAMYTNKGGVGAYGGKLVVQVMTNGPTTGDVKMTISDENGTGSFDWVSTGAAGVQIVGKDLTIASGTNFGNGVVVEFNADYYFGAGNGAPKLAFA